MNEAGASAREIALVGELTGDWWADVQVRSAILRSVKDSIAKCKARRENAERERDRLASEVVQEMILWTRLTKLSDSLELFGHEADDDSGPGF